MENRTLLSVAPAGVEFPVNLHTTNEQVAPRVATDANGNFVVVWVSRAQVGTATYFQREHGEESFEIYARSGRRKNTEFEHILRLEIW